MVNFTLASSSEFDPSKHLAVSYVVVNNHINPSMVAISLKHSKTNQFRHGTTIYLGATGTSICPFMLEYLAIRPPGNGPLFLTH